MKNKELNFKEFNSVSKQEWVDKAIIDLKGADFNKKLVWKNLNKIDLPPFYHPEDQINSLTNTGENTTSVNNYRLINVNSWKKGNRLAKTAVEEGMNALLFDMEKNVNIRKLLNDIDLNSVAVSFIVRRNEIGFVKDFINLVEEKNIDPAKLRGYIDLKIIYEYVTTGNIHFKKFDFITEIIELTKKYPNFRSVSVSGTVFLDSGANQIQEIAFSLSALVFFIDELSERGSDVQEIFDNLHIELGIGSEFFIEIGKFRAFNSLIHKIAEKYNVSLFTYDLIAKTCRWNKSVIDAYTNMLRLTTEAMSAVLGNVNGVIIDSFDNEFNKVTDFSSRISGNILHILKGESYFGMVSNPVDGSYYTETITTNLAQKALELFKGIEERGDFYESFEGGIIQQQIAEICLVKIKLLSLRRLTMVGVNKYPNLMEEIDPEILSFPNKNERTRKSLLKPKRAAFEIEALRKRTEDQVKKTGKRAVVELVGFGNLAMRKARAGFAYDFMGISGFKIWAEKSFCCAEKAAVEAAASSSDIVVICSSDEDYKNHALDFVKKFREENIKKILLLAGNLPDIEVQLAAAGLDGFIHVRSDLVQIHSGIQDKLEKILIPSEI